MIQIAIVILAAALFFMAVMVIDNHRFVVRRYKVGSPAVCCPVRIVFIADLHEKDYGDGNEKLANEIAKLKPDMILVGGDLIVSGKVFRHLENAERSARDDAMHSAGNDAERLAASSTAKDRDPGTEWMKNSIALMRKLSRICPVCFVRGNHEIRLAYYGELREYDALFCRQMEEAGVVLIKNGCMDVAAQGHREKDSGIRIQGLELPVNYYEKFKKTNVSAKELERMIGKADPSKFTVLLTHTPVHFEQYAEWGADLCLCGHVHGGLMRLPLIGGVMGTRPNLFPKYSGGQYFYETVGESGNRKSSMIVTCGLGMHTLPIRIFNPGEISVIELIPDESGEAVQE